MGRLSHTMKLTARASMEYGRRRLRVGDAFDATSRDARILVLIGKAKYAEDPPAVIAPVLEAEVAPAIPTSRRYRRRDLQAQV